MPAKRAELFVGGKILNEAGENLDKLYPICVVQNRFGSHVGGGAWLAVAKGNDWYKIQSRMTWIFMDEAGPLGEERDAVAFWRNPPRWIAAGATPNDAIAALQEKMLD